MTAHVVQVVAAGEKQRIDSGDLEYSSALAGRLQTLSGRVAEAEVLFDRNVEAAIAEYAGSIGASLIVTSTHGRSGTSRLVLGSTA